MYNIYNTHILQQKNIKMYNIYNTHILQQKNIKTYKE